MRGRFLQPLAQLVHAAAAILQAAGQIIAEFFCRTQPALHGGLFDLAGQFYDLAPVLGGQTDGEIFLYDAAQPAADRMGCAEGEFFLGCHGVLVPLRKNRACPKSLATLGQSR